MISNIKFTLKNKQNILLQLSFKNESEKNIFLNWLNNSDSPIECSSTYLRIDLNLNCNEVNQFLDYLYKNEKITAADLEKYQADLTKSDHSSEGFLVKRRKLVNKSPDPKLPAPPPLPNLASPGYSSIGYWQLLHSLPQAQRESILDELKTAQLIDIANYLENELCLNGYNHEWLNNSRTIFLAALLCVQRNSISINQLATVHLIDSALHTLYFSVISFISTDFVDIDGTVVSNIAHCKPPKDTQFANSFRRLKFNLTTHPDDQINIDQLLPRLRKPLIQRFFNFNALEWVVFCQEMSQAPLSEQFFYVVNAPKFGCWSVVIFQLQKFLKCMQVLDWAVRHNGGITFETIMLVPSFTMFQAAINAKANTLNRKPVQLLPTYNYLDAETYSRYKCVGIIPMSMYLPEEELALQYQDTTGSFRQTIDGNPLETHFAGAIHDVYHGLREMQMTENIAMARMRLASIAQQSPLNKTDPNNFSVSELLIDGELLFNYPTESDTVFAEEYRPMYGEQFGDLFYTQILSNLLHPDLKRAFIRDMVVHAEGWLECFNLGRNDLRSADQTIYDQIIEELQSSSSTRLIRH